MKRLLLLFLCCLCLITGCAPTPTTTKEKPQHIVTMNLDADEIILDLVPPQRITALSALVDDPAISYTSAQAKAVSQRVRAYTVEEILSLHPDLVITSDWMDQAMQATLRDTGIRVLVYHEAKTLDEIPPVITAIAEAVGEKEQGEHLIAQFHHDVKAALAHAQPSTEKLLLWAYHRPYGAGDSLFGDMCRKLGLINTLEPLTTAELGAITQEYLLELNPDVILLTNWHFAEEDIATLSQEFRTNPAYRTMSAVEQERYCQIHGRALFCPNHYAGRGMEEIITALEHKSS